jgi:hypothetical protein
MFRFSGAFGWNPPFAPGPQAHNKPGARAPDPQEYWNYGTDDDFADANRWDGTAFPPPEEPEEGAEAEAKAHLTSLATGTASATMSMRAADFEVSSKAASAPEQLTKAASSAAASSAAAKRQDERKRVVRSPLASAVDFMAPQLDAGA